jgi:uncharacterized membrane protein
MSSITNAELDKRVALLEQTVQRLATDLHQINESINKLVWVVGAALITYVMKFIVMGGLA